MESYGNDRDFLQHYGVLGMKWGVRKNPEYTYQSHATKKYGRKASKYAAKLTKLKSSGSDNAKIQKTAEKMNVFKNRQKKSQELDKQEQEGAKNVTTGKAVATRLLFGGAMSKAYHQNLAMMGKNVKTASKGQKFTARVASYYGMTPFSRIMKAGYIRSGEKNSKLAKLSKGVIGGMKTTGALIDAGRDKVKKTAKKYK